MSDFERRLRDALHGAAESAPPGLLAAVMRRHRRRKLRVGAGVLAVAPAAALAVPPVSAALRGTGRGAGPPPSAPPSRASRPVTAPRMVLAGCDDANIGAIGAHWRSGATHAAGPLWFIDGGHSPGRAQSGSIRLYVAIAVLDGLKPGSVVVLRVAPGWQQDLRFLYGSSDMMTPRTQHLPRLAGHGELGVTLRACTPAEQTVPSRHYTDYYGGYLIRGARCVPVRAWLPGRTHPVTIRLGACAGR